MSTKPVKLENVPPVKTIACGAYHLLMITIDEDLWSIGRNDYGQLCIGNSVKQSKPQQTKFSNVTHVGAGAVFSLFTSREQIYACGYNNNGQLGLNDWKDRFNPEIIPNQPPDIVQISCGYSHALFLDIEGNVFCVGDNTNGKLGLGNKPNQKELNQLQNLPTIVYVSAVCNSSYLLDTEGNVWSFGDDRYGKLAHFDEIGHNIPKKVEHLKDIKQISYGYSGHHFLAKDSQDKIFAAGNNLGGQLGVGDTLNKPCCRLISSSSLIWGDARKSRAKSARK